MRDPCDAFVSYAHAGAGPVERLVTVPERRGLRAWVDRTGVADHASITRAVGEGFTRSKALLAFCSATYPRRRACQWELTAAFLAAQRKGRTRSPTSAAPSG